MRMLAGEFAATGSGWAAAVPVAVPVPVVVVVVVVVAELAMSLRPLGRPCCVTIVMALLFRNNVLDPFVVPGFVYRCSRLVLYPSESRTERERVSSCPYRMCAGKKISDGPSTGVAVH